MIINKHFCNDNKFQDSTVYTDTVSTPVPVVSHETTDDDIKRFLSESDYNLQKRDLSFKEVDEIYNKYNSKDIDRCKNINSDICERIEDYKKVADYISNKDYGGIVTYINQKNKKINIVHLNLVKLITNGVVSGLSGFDAYDYDSSRSKEVKDYFMAKEFQSFFDLLNIAKKYKKPITTPAPVFPKRQPKTPSKVTPV